MSVECLFCKNDVCYDDGKGTRPTENDYECTRCGHVYLTRVAAEDFAGERFNANQKNVLSIVHRNGYEMRAKRPKKKALTLGDLYQILKQYKPLDPIEKMDNALLILEKLTHKVGHRIKVSVAIDFPYYHCFDQQELSSVLDFLMRDEFIRAKDDNPHNEIFITAKGYQKLRNLKKVNVDSRKCFVAMWFTPEMNKIFDDAIKPAIKYVEEGYTTTKFEAVKIDNVEHINDINDEVIAQIRRSRFMVCDLTGYRGGVYFEAGFAYGLGIPVINTCRKDWTKRDELTDENGNVVERLYDKNRKPIKVQKEGVHFDLSHINRIEWEEDKLSEFKIALENRIKAVITP